MNDLMIVKLLNGDLIQVNTCDPDTLKRTVADNLGVYWSQVCIVCDAPNEDHQEKFVLVMILEKPVITFTKHHTSILNKIHKKDWMYHQSYDWSNFVNPDIIKHYLQHMESMTNWSNPHPLVVEYILKTQPKVTRLSRFFANPAEPIVDRILDYLQETKDQPYFTDWSKLSMNPNPRIIQTLIEHFPTRINTNYFGSLNNDHAVHFAWHNMLSTSANKDIFWYSVANNKLNDVSIQYQLECLSERVPEHLEHMMRIAPSHSHPKIVKWFVDELDKQFKSLQMSQVVDVPVAFIANPNSIAVNWLFEHLSLIEQDQRYLRYFCSNAHDRVVQWLLDDPHRIKLPEFLCNPNPLAIEYIKQSRPLYNQTYWESILKNSNVDLLVWAWHEWFAFTEDLEHLIIDIEHRLALTDKICVQYQET